MVRTRCHRGGNHRTVCDRAKMEKKRLDPDQVCELLTPEKLAAIENRQNDPFLPGEGKYYCLICDKHFISQHAYDSHARGGQHRLRLREVKDGGFNPNRAMKVAGKGVDNGKKLNRGETVQPAEAQPDEQ